MLATTLNYGVDAFSVKVTPVKTCDPILIMPKSWLGIKCADGMYSSKDRHIYIDESAEDWKYNYIIKHEYCHDIWYYQISGQKRKYYSYWHKRRPFTPTEYSKTSTEENFAEVCAYIMNDGPVGNRHYQARFLKSFLNKNPIDENQFQRDSREING